MKSKATYWKSLDKENIYSSMLSKLAKAGCKCHVVSPSVVNSTCSSSALTAVGYASLH